jgi:polyisoprenoid-binding protein YceI
VKEVKDYMDTVKRPGINQDIPVKRPMLSGTFIKIGLVFVVLFVLLVGGGAAYIWFSGGTGQSSAVLTAPSLTVSATGKIFKIVQDSSEVRFITHETLLGQPKTVVGSTNQVAGDIMIDFTHPENIRLGTIRINVKTLTTDNEFRNRALRGQILQATSSDFEFATFVPGKIIGIPDKITFGQTLTLQITGSLMVHGVTREVTFDAVITPVNETRLEGSAHATIHYQDFNITIPDAPGVAGVSEEIRLEINFVALPVHS